MNFLESVEEYVSANENDTDNDNDNENTNDNEYDNESINERDFDNLSSNQNFVPIKQYQLNIIKIEIWTMVLF